MRKGLPGGQEWEKKKDIQNRKGAASAEAGNKDHDFKKKELLMVYFIHAENMYSIYGASVSPIQLKKQNITKMRPLLYPSLLVTFPLPTATILNFL